MISWFKGLLAAIFFGYPWKAVTFYSLTTRPWADTFPENNSKVDFAIRLGMAGARFGPDWLLEYEETTGNTSVLDPHKFKVKAKRVYSKGTGGLRWDHKEFEFEIESFTIRRIAEAVRDVMISEDD